MNASAGGRTGAPRVLVVGHVTRDRIVVDDGPPRTQPGGSAFYAAAVHARLGMPTALATCLAARDRARLLQPLTDLGVAVTALGAPATTTFENTYHGGERSQRVLRRAPPLKPRDIGGLAARAIQLGPLTPGDIPPATVIAARARCAWLALDLQGMLRRISGGRVHPARRVDPALLAQADIVKVGQGEARLLCGLADPRLAALRIAGWSGGEAVVTLGAAGALIASGTHLYEVQPVSMAPVVDTTGCGDSFLAAYFARRLLGDPPPAAGRFAAGVAALSATRAGPFDGDAAEVHALLHGFDAA